MNCLTANNIPITQILKTIYQSTPEEIRGKEVKYKAPNRNERIASLSVNIEMNVWKDFGSGKGGKAIDLVCELSGVSPSGALLILSRMKPEKIEHLSFSRQSPDSRFNLDHIQPLQNSALIQYLQNRKISYAIASKVSQLKEAYWTYNKRRYFALAFENDLHGFELRNNVRNTKYPRGYKGGTSPKTITTIQGSQSGLNLFEGFFDYLSALSFFPFPSYNSTIVLNGIGNINKVDLAKYSRINLFLDNDCAGNKLASRIISQFPNAVNRSIQLYPTHKDFNEYLNR